MLRTLGVSVLFLALIFACGPSSQDRVRACVDMGEAVARFAADRCKEGTFAKNYDDWLKLAACGDCKNIVGVRDLDALYRECLPMLANATCAEAAQVGSSEACKGQLISARMCY